MDDKNHTDCHVELEEIELTDHESPRHDDVTDSNINNNNNNNNNNRYSISNSGSTGNFNNNNSSNMNGTTTANETDYNRYSSVSSQLTTSSKKSILSNKKELKQLRKPSDRIRSKSYCATFCYNIPRSSLMIVLPGIVILVTGAILTATADSSDRGGSWTDGGVLLVSLVFLILGGVWTLGGIIYWLITWFRYKPEVVKRGQLGEPQVATASASVAMNNRTTRADDASLATPSTTFESLNSPFTVIPHPIFSQQQLQLSQQQLNSQPTQQQQPQQQQQQQSRSVQLRFSSDAQQDLMRHKDNAQQQLQHNSQQLQQHAQYQQQIVRENASKGFQEVSEATQKKQHVADEVQHFQHTLQQQDISDCYY